MADPKLVTQISLVYLMGNGCPHDKPQKFHSAMMKIIIKVIIVFDEEPCNIDIILLA